MTEHFDSMRAKHQVKLDKESARYEERESNKYTKCNMFIDTDGTNMSNGSVLTIQVNPNSTIGFKGKGLSFQRYDIPQDLFESMMIAIGIEAKTMI